MSAFVQKCHSVTSQWLTDADLRRWRACTRMQWLHRQRGDAPPDSVPAPAEPDVVYGPEPEQALRASFPDARVVPAPQTEAEWQRAARLTAQALADPALQTPGAAILGACVRSDDARVQANLAAMNTLRRALGTKVGWSDHSRQPGVIHRAQANPETGQKVAKSRGACGGQQLKNRLWQQHRMPSPAMERGLRNRFAVLRRFWKNRTQCFQPEVWLISQ